jgi:hypothetical protein
VPGGLIAAGVVLLSIGVMGSRGER